MIFHVNRQLVNRLLLITLAPVFMVISQPTFGFFYSPPNTTAASSSNPGQAAAAAKKSAATKKKPAPKKSASKKKKPAPKKSASKKKKPAPKKSASKNNTNKQKSSSNSNPPNYVSINPTLDLGIDKGYRCFRVKSYTNQEVSDFSEPVCGYIPKNTNKFKVAWAADTNKVIGYQVYFGNSANKTNSFLADIR